MSIAVRRPTGLAGPLVLSLLLHAGAVLPFVLIKAASPPALPPMYRVDLVAAPPGPRAVGIVRETAPAEPAEAKVPPKAATTTENVARAPIDPPTRRPPPTRATENVTAKATPRVAPEKATTAGGGETGGTGTDVANVRTEGIEFPFPGYLRNIVRQIALNFSPRNPGALRAEVYFLIRRDGTVTGVRFVTRSGNFAFDLEAEAAIEAAARSFGPLPAGFTDDILPIVFSFDPATLR